MLIFISLLTDFLPHRQGVLLPYLFFFAFFHQQFHDGTSPPATVDTDIPAAYPLKSHLIRNVILPFFCTTFLS